MPPATDANLAYQDLQPDDILNALEALGHACDGHLLALNSYENRVYRLGVEDGPPIVAKFYRPGRWTDTAILEEHTFAAELAALDIPVVAPEIHGGQSLHRYNGFRFAVFKCRGGHAPELDDMQLQHQVGRLLARIHNAGEVRPFLHRPELDLESFGIRSRDRLLQGGWIPDDLREVYADLCGHLFAEIGSCFDRAASPQYLRIHGDFHPGNLLVLDEQIHIVDLDDVRMGPAVQDLWMFLSGDRREQAPQLDALLEGYTEFRNFDARELHLVEALRTLRIIHYSAWLAQRWQDPAFRVAFPWFDTHRYWDEHILSLREQAALMTEPPLPWGAGNR